MASSIGFVLWWITLYSFALLNYVLYLGIAVRNGTFFRRSTEREKNELLLGKAEVSLILKLSRSLSVIARDHYWNLSHSVFELYHRFFVLRNGRQLHYFTNAATANASTPQSKNLVIFLHGFPDSSLLWRYVVESSILRQNATLVAVDLPGFGGSDSLPRYSASDVLESLTEFIVAMRERYLGTNDADSGQGEDPTDKVFIVGHDWGCLLGYRLAAEAPSLAHRFILTNAPHVCVLPCLFSCLTKDPGLISAEQQGPHPYC
jgi:Alpha/beta hydrolase family